MNNNFETQYRRLINDFIFLAFDNRVPSELKKAEKMAVGVLTYNALKSGWCGVVPILGDMLIECDRVFNERSN